MTENNAKEFASEKAKQDELHSALNVADAAIKAFPKGSMGLTLDCIKTTPEFRLANFNYKVAFEKLRAFNGPFVKRFKKEILADRKVRKGY